MNKQKNLIYFMLVAFLGIIAIIAAYKSSEKHMPNQEENEIALSKDESIEIYRPVITQEPEETQTPIEIFYYLQLEDRDLKLYEINGEARKEVKSIEINPEMLPSEDIELLKNGIQAFTLEEGVEIIENFIS